MSWASVIYQRSCVTQHIVLRSQQSVVTQLLRVAAVQSTAAAGIESTSWIGGMLDRLDIHRRRLNRDSVIQEESKIGDMVVKTIFSSFYWS